MPINHEAKNKSFSLFIDRLIFYLLLLNLLMCLCDLANGIVKTAADASTRGRQLVTFSLIQRPPVLTFPGLVKLQRRGDPFHTGSSCSL